MPLVIRAYLEGSRTLLGEHCAPEMLERLSGLISAQQAQARPPQALPGSTQPARCCLHMLCSHEMGVSRGVMASGCFAGAPSLPP